MARLEIEFQSSNRTERPGAHRMPAAGVRIHARPFRRAQRGDFVDGEMQLLYAQIDPVGVGMWDLCDRAHLEEQLPPTGERHGEGPRRLAARDRARVEQGL